MDSCIGEQVRRSKRYCNNPRPKNGGRHYSASGVRVLSKSSLLPGKNYNGINRKSHLVSQRFWIIRVQN